LADLQWMVFPHSGHPSAEGREQDRVSLLANCATQPTMSGTGHRQSTEGRSGAED